MKHYNFLIVGQGLAGSLLTYQLIKQNKSFLVIDDNSKLSSSKVAAGMFCPVGGKRMLKTWLADNLIEKLDKVYTELETFLNTTFYYKQDIIQYFNDNELEHFNKLINIPKNDERSIYIDLNKKTFKNIYDSSSITIKDGGWVNTEILLNSFEHYLKSNNYLINNLIDYKKIQKIDNKWIYNDFSFDNIVFCEGYKSINNPFFNYLPFQLSKGEVITVNIKEMPNEFILKKGVYLVSLDNETYKVGASYEWKDLSLDSTEKGVEFIKNKLNTLIKSDYIINNKLVGIRPTILDKKPLLGEHSENKNMYIFNGLGTKGVMLAPYFSEVLIDFILNKKPLPLEVDIKRFKV
ncbi:MAG: FAD-dependent oxidoreductase [Candidatus Sericytochromatia bacterium]